MLPKQSCKVSLPLPRLCQCCVHPKGVPPSLPGSRPPPNRSCGLRPPTPCCDGPSSSGWSPAPGWQPVPSGPCPLPFCYRPLPTRPDQYIHCFSLQNVLQRRVLPVHAPAVLTPRLGRPLRRPTPACPSSLGSHLLPKEPSSPRRKSRLWWTPRSPHWPLSCTGGGRLPP